MTANDFFKSYVNGQRHFDSLDFENIDGFSNHNFENIVFQNCFLCLDFKESNFSNAQFIGCNIKGIDLRKANLTNALMKNCLVESALFKGATTTGFTFIENYYYGTTIGQREFDTDLINADAYILEKELAEMDYKKTLGPKMIDVTETAEPVTDIWSYVDALVYEKIVDKYVRENNLVQSVYRNSNGSYDHVLLPTKNENTYIVIIVNIHERIIVGHYKLNLASQYDC